MNRTRILLADDHKIVTEGLQSLLRDEFELVGAVGDGYALLETARQVHPDVIVVDISMPKLNGLDAARRLRQEKSTAKIIFLTMHADPQLAVEAFRAGASGFLLKHSAGEELVAAIHEVLQGHAYLTPLIAKDLITTLIAATEQPSQDTVPLTPRQREILQLLAEGRTMKEIGAILNVSTRTVESHKYDMMRELGIQTTAELIQYAVKIGLVAR